MTAHAVEGLILSRWRHGFESRWGCDGISAGQRPCPAHCRNPLVGSWPSTLAINDPEPPMARGSMRQRSNDSWQLRVYLGYVDGRRRFAARTVRGTRREAEAALAAFQVEANTGQAAPSARGTVGAFLDEWFEAFAGDWSPTTQATVRGAIDLYLRPVLGDRR